ncbi:hypothetical protein NGUA23_00999 [Salmonella enterica]|nr:hypothetical protein NGUA01_04612 [Salmonella enterica]GAR01418.1 hypothetical protein NGUA02_01074 [Salmonella enterica]GAR25884.1 hypothetical protein NGUA07_03342 [Salmonella enterica]GAR67228.1 hypothetical protein NGUA16_04084 [Salmonella enterica]GAR74961.1 hypothetical protein NGUA18_02866 [Salmonella enterica]
MEPAAHPVFFFPSLLLLPLLLGFLPGFVPFLPRILQRLTGFFFLLPCGQYGRIAVNALPDEFFSQIQSDAVR